VSYKITTTFTDADEAFDHFMVRAGALEASLVDANNYIRILQDKLDDLSEVQKKIRTLESDKEESYAQNRRLQMALDEANATIASLRADLEAEKAKPCKPTIWEMDRFRALYLNTTGTWEEFEVGKKQSLIDKVWGEVTQ
jgi:peptidoglycan hydrolase CwlO-like protein